MDSRDPYLCLHAVNIYVRDQERSLRFYVDQLGFNLAFEARLQSGRRWIAVSPPDGTAVLALIEAVPDSPEFNLVGRHTQIVFVTQDVAGTYAEWRRRGVRFHHTPRLRRFTYDSLAPATMSDHASAWGGVFTRFEDLDRNSFALVSFDEVSRAIEAQRRAVAHKQEIERRTVQELDYARQVQARLFPQTLPPLHTLEYAGVCVQARQVGGDYYDFLNLGQDRLGLVVGDIAGKGMAAALLMANLQANLRSQCATALDQHGQFLKSVNRLFYENTPDTAYATLFFAEYDDRQRRLRYVNCGHLCGLLFREDNTVERLHSTGTVLGIFEDWDCESAECELHPGDALALYTDGVTESFNEREEDFGEQGLIDAIQRRPGLAPNQLLSAILEDLRQFSPHEQHDDITLIVAKCH